MLSRLGKKFDYTPVNQKLIDDLTLSLETLFHWADRGSTAFSIESRMPLMDHRLVEFLAAVPAAYKLHGGWTKYLARKAFDGKLPENICWRRDKMGWPIPEEFWFKGKLREHFVRTLKDSEFLLRVGVDFSDVSETEVFDRYSFAFLLRCYVLETWHSVFWGRGACIPVSPGNPNLD
jgi:asparagine synthase (glutamine-hydrolysing)